VEALGADRAVGQGLPLGGFVAWNRLAGRSLAGQELNRANGQQCLACRAPVGFPSWRNLGALLAVLGKHNLLAAVDNSYELTEDVFGMSKVITPHFEKVIDRFVASGRFNNKSEVIRAGLRLLEEHEAIAAAASRDDLSRIIQTALRDPRPLIPATDLLRRRQRR
jgi:antitoxin ParD1/3/4